MKNILCSVLLGLCLCAPGLTWAGENFGFQPVGQIAFGAGCPNATSDPNVLDCYQEGSWTPTLGGTATYGVQSGYYVKIGQFVFANFQLNITAIGTGTVSTISGLPFAASALSGFTSTCSIMAQGTTAAFTYVVGRIQGSLSQIDLFALNAGTIGGPIATSVLTTGTNVFASCMYRAGS